MVIKTKIRAGQRIVALVGLAAVAAGGLAGCSGSGAGEDTGDGKQLTVWMPGNNEAEIALMQKTIVPAFEKQTGADVKLTYVDWTNISTKLNAAFAAGTAPDVFAHGPAAAADFVANGRLEPLTDDVSRLGSNDRKDLAAALPSGRVDGTQYLMPLSNQGNLIMYDADAFKAAGLDPAAPPTTWQDLRKDAEKLTKRSGSGSITRAGLLLPSQVTVREQTFLALLAGQGGTLVNKAGTAATWNSPAGANALDFFRGLYSGSDAVSTDLGEDYLNAPAAQQPLVRGTAAMTMLGSTQMEAVKKAAPDKDLRVMPPLAFGSGTAAAVGGAGEGLMMNADSHEKALAWKFMAFMTSSKISAEYAEGIGAVPLRSSAASSAYVKDDPIMEAFVAAAPHWVANPNVAGWVQVRDLLDAQLEQALNGKTSSAAALQTAATSADKLLKANG